MLIYALKLQIEKWCIYNYAHGHTGQWTLLDFYTETDLSCIAPAVIYIYGWTL